MARLTADYEAILPLMKDCKTEDDARNVFNDNWHLVVMTVESIAEEVHDGI